MNAYHLCTLLVTSMIATATVTQAPLDERPILPDGAATPSHPAVKIYTHGIPSAPRVDLGKGWELQNAAFSDDPDGFRAKSLMEIESYAVAMENMTQRAETSRTYLKTRLQALREHAAYARAELVKLPTSPGEEDFTTAHAHFHQTMDSLHEAFTQALNELNDGV